MTYKKCPHYKGESGFEITVRRSGYHILKVGFNGEIIEEEKRGTDNIEKYGSCLDCGKGIIATSLDIKRV